MPLLALDGVTKTYVRGRRELVALRGVTLELDAGEIVGIWGRRFSGRTTLLRIAGGLERPDEGRVLLGGVDVATCSERDVRGRVSFSHGGFSRAHAELVVEHVAVPLLATGARIDRACAQAHAMLERLGAGACAELRPDELDHGEITRVAIARALLPQPRLLLVDEPTNGVDLTERDALLRTLCTVAREDGVAVLMTGAETTALAGADRMLSISSGELRGETVPSSAEVVPLARQRVS
ncbi:MAG TPA: ATP-binding cassette domain-containing protein [Conexibacter sp.]|nr:ATP-binding cassette domain-containing protein [Conexibacter sp.]